VPNPPASHDGEDDHFSPSIFAVTVVSTLIVIAAALRYAAPASVWREQLGAGFLEWAAAFVAVTGLNCFVEYFFHRYVLHKPLVPLFRHFYRAHTKHHSLTRIGRRRTPEGRDVPFIENIYPIIEEKQHESSFFPWYSLAVFALILTPVLMAAQWLLPEFPWFFAGYGALAASLALYELLHAVEHFSFEQWGPLIEHRRWGGFWRKVYSFHLRHHAVIDCNESISGFFTLPVADWVFGTCIIPPGLYADGAEWHPSQFLSPRPCAFIRWCDRASTAVVERRRAKAQEPAGEPADLHAPSPPGETLLNWVTHGLGLALSVSCLVVLVTLACLRGDVWHVVSFAAFGATLVLLYATSTLYHGFRTTRWNATLQRFNRASIFLLIAGTYTPFLLVSLRGPWGWSLFAVVWGLSISGVVFQLFFAGRFRAVATYAYLLVGWLAVVAIKPLVASVPHGALWLMLAGGLSYTAGVVFHRLKHLHYRQVVWQAFVLGGSACHLAAVMVFMMPVRA
jgi:hemolysin III